MPHGFAATGRGPQLLAVRVGAGQAAVVGAVPFGDAGDEERHRTGRADARRQARRDLSAALSRRGRLLRERDVGTEDQRTVKATKTGRRFFMSVLSLMWCGS